MGDGVNGRFFFRGSFRRERLAREFDQGVLVLPNPLRHLCPTRESIFTELEIIGQDRQHVLDIPYHKDEGFETGGAFNSMHISWKAGPTPACVAASRTAR